jgi:hypothetical protein
MENVGKDTNINKTDAPYTLLLSSIKYKAGLTSCYSRNEPSTLLSKHQRRGELSLRMKMWNSRFCKITKAVLEQRCPLITLPASFSWKFRTSLPKVSPLIAQIIQLSQWDDCERWPEIMWEEAEVWTDGRKLQNSATFFKVFERRLESGAYIIRLRSANQSGHLTISHYSTQQYSLNRCRN